MKTLIRIYDPTTKITLTLCHFPAFDGPIEQYDNYIIKESIEDGNRVLDIDYARYLQNKQSALMKYIAENSRIVLLDLKSK